MEECYLLKHHLIPKEEMIRVFRESYSASAEIDTSFLCFDKPYQDVVRVADKDSVILDLGCGYAAQSFYFAGCKAYIGVDLPLPRPTKNESLFSNWKPETRFTSDNTKFYIMSIQTFIAEALPTLQLDMDHVIAICSAVPDTEAMDLVKKTFPIHYISYPGEKSDITLPLPTQTLEQALHIKEEPMEKLLDIANAKFIQRVDNDKDGITHLYHDLPITAYPSLSDIYSSECNLQLDLSCPYFNTTKDAVLKLSVMHHGVQVGTTALTLQPGIDYTKKDIEDLWMMQYAKETSQNRQSDCDIEQDIDLER